MKQFTMRLKEDTQRPIIRLKNWYQLNALLDTGALFPVWIEAEDILINLGAQLVTENIIFSGFGGNTTGNLYKLPLFIFGELIYPGFHIIATRHNLPCQLILPATMFCGLRYEIDDENHVLNVTLPSNQSNVRNLIITSNSGKLTVLCVSAPSP